MPAQSKGPATADFHVTRRALVLAGAALPAWAHARDTPMREATDLRTAFASASPARPFVLLASIRGCPFCEFVRRSYLLPMNKEGSLNAWQLSMDRSAASIGFDGKTTAPRELAVLLGVRTTPTVLFLSAQGKALAEPLVGVVSSEFYGAMLEERLASAARSA